jgi:hypothetical protein
MGKDRMLGEVMNMNRRYKYSRETKKTVDGSRKTQPTISRKYGTLKKSPNQGISGVKTQCKHVSGRGFIQL